MRWIAAWRQRLRSLFLRSREEAEMVEELRFHLEQEAELLRQAGLEPREARRQARIRFGSFERFKEEVREARGTGVIDSLWRDTRYAARRLTHDWRFTLPAVLILALGIGANTAMFSVVNTALFQTLPYADADRLVNIYQNSGETSRPAANSFPAYLDMAAYTDVFSGVAAFMGPGQVRYQMDSAIRSGVSEFATPSYLAVHGLALSLGRWFTPEDESSGGRVAVLGHRTWSVEFGADPSVLGRAIRINGEPVTIIGVGPAGYNSGFHSGIVTDFWLPTTALTTVAGRSAAMLESREFDWESSVQVRARLREGVGLPQAQAAMTALGARLAAEYPQEDPGRGISVAPSQEVLVHPEFDSFVSAGASLLMIIVGLVLAIACTNLATWLLVRGLARAKEVSVRLALGATRRQVVRHLVVESTLLATAGGALGYLLAEWTIRLVALADLPLDFNAGLDYRVLAFTLVLSLLTGVVFGLGPALKATRVTLAPSLRGDGDTPDPTPRPLNLKNALVVSQVALSFVLLLGEGVYLRFLAATQAVELGFRTEGLAFVQTDARFAGYSPAEALALHETLRERISALPGVEAAALAVLPPPSWNAASELLIDGYQPVDGENMEVRWVWAGPEYFDVLGVPLLNGRSFNAGDGADSPGVAVINESMARRYFGTPNAVGRRFRLADSGTETRSRAPRAELEVIGVVADVLTSIQDLRWTPRPAYYLSHRQGAPMTSTIVARTAADAASLLRPMREAARSLDETLPITLAKTMPQHIADSLGVRRQIGALLGALGALGLGLACLGLYVVVGFAVSRKAREIGIRMTLGAQRTRVIWALSKSVSKLLAVGVVIGLALSWLLLRLSATVFRRLDPSASLDLGAPASADQATYALGDPMTFALVLLLMVAVGLAATFLPAWRATRTSPVAALRHL